MPAWAAIQPRSRRTRSTGSRSNRGSSGEPGEGVVKQLLARRPGPRPDLDHPEPLLRLASRRRHWAAPLAPLWGAEDLGLCRRAWWRFTFVDVSEAASLPPSGPAKLEIVAEIGDAKLLLPSLVNRGLDANGRAKYLLSLLQAARAWADLGVEPGTGVPAGAGPAPFSSLRDERLAAGITDPEFDSVVERSRREGPDCYVIPGAARIHRDLIDAITDMLAPFATPGAEISAGVDPDRLERLSTETPDLTGDRVPGTYINRITSARPGEGDSLHLLVMDAHRALNRLQSALATTSIDGAAVYGLADDDRSLVAAFMAGVHKTAALKFEHPGLATSATRTANRLLIQNDLGTTNAHVVVLAVEGLTATLTYTDVHLRRLQFFESLFDGFAVAWSNAQRQRGSPSLGEHHLTVGTYHAPDRDALEAFVRHVGSRLVFVLDWNRARKRLGAFLPNQDAVDVLRWAADSNVGHIAFLTLGAERLIYEAVELSARIPARYGEPLIDLLGRDATLAVTKFALRCAAEGLLAGKSALLIRDELRVEVLRHVQAAHLGLLDASAEHASLIVECAQALHSALVRLGTPEGDGFLQRAVQRAAKWEHSADEILIGQRQSGRRVEGSQTITSLTATADDAIDSFEEAVFSLTLLPAGSVAVARPILDPVAATAVMTAREHLKVVALARQIVAGAAPEDLEDFLVAVDKVATLEHDADTADRMARAALVSHAPEFRSLYVADSVSRSAEAATDALLRSALGLRDHILGAVAAR